MRRTQTEVLDELLVLRGQAGDREAVGALARRWHRRHLAFAWRLTGRADAAADVVQEAWIGILKGLGRLDDPARFRSWAFRIVANKARDRIRREISRRRATESAGREPPEPPRRPDEPEASAVATDRERAVARMRGALARLPDDRRALLSMLYLEGMSVREIAIALDVPEGTVKSRLWHARETLREHLGKE